jgi:hypothetical protein
LGEGLSAVLTITNSLSGFTLDIFFPCRSFLVGLLAVIVVCSPLLVAAVLLIAQLSA